MERKVGEIIYLEGVHLRVVADGELLNPCKRCYFGFLPDKCVGLGYILGPCAGYIRKDEIGIHFEEIKKGGRK